MAIRKKKTIRKIPKTGLNAVPFDKGFQSTLHYFQYNVEKKQISDIIKTYIKNNYNASDKRNILANSEWRFSTYSHYGCVAYWINTKQEPHCKSYSKATIEEYFGSFKKYIDSLIEPGIKLLEEKKLKEKEEENIIVLSPQQRLQKKIGETIIQDLLELEDQWIEGKETSINVYEQFKLYGLSGSATLPVQTMVEGWLLDYEDAYKKEDSEFKIVSINPIQIIGCVMLYTFNTKYKVLTQYVTRAGNGFEISGSTIKNFSKEDSRSIKLRKPDEFLPIVMSKSQTQIDKEWNTLTTKTTKPNGRLNAETILLRVK